MLVLTINILKWVAKCLNNPHFSQSRTRDKAKVSSLAKPLIS